MFYHPLPYGLPVFFFLYVTELPRKLCVAILQDVDDDEQMFYDILIVHEATPNNVKSQPVITCQVGFHTLVKVNCVGIKFPVPN
jgi:hypothetical protein